MMTGTEIWEMVSSFFFQGIDWLPAPRNTGFGASSFISFSVAFNVAIAKWEQLRKTLSDADAQFSELFEKEVKRHRSGAIFADEEFQKEANEARGVCDDRVREIKEKNKALWQRARPWAWVGALIGAAFLFFGWSMGASAIFLYLVPALLWKKTSECKKQIPKEIENTFATTIALLKKRQETKTEEKEKEISKALKDL